MSPLYYRNLTIIPTYHANLDFAQEVRKYFYREIPDAIAVEFPENLKNLIFEGVNRLPKISIITAFDDVSKEQLFIPIDPADSLIEAIRLGQEYGQKIEFIDCFVKNYHPKNFARPDSFALNHISLEEFYTHFRREWELDAQAEAQFRKQEIRIQQSQLKKEQEQDLLESEGDTEHLKTGEDVHNWLKKSEELDDLRDHYMAARLHELMAANKRILVVIGLAHWEHIKTILEHGDIPEDLTAFQTDVTGELYNVESEDLPNIMLETPNIVAQWENFRTLQKTLIDDEDPFDPEIMPLKRFDIFRGIKEIIFRSVRRFKSEYDEEISIHKLKSLFQYMRNLPIIENMIKPTLFDIVLAAKSILNDEFAWIVWEECKRFPGAGPDSDYETAHFTEKGIVLKGKFFKIRRRIPIPIHRIKLPLKPIPKENHKGEWKEIWQNDGWNLVSHIPEDLFEENYFQHVRHRALNLMKDRYVKIHQFTSTLMDGIDFRETIRNWALDQKIYVREERSIQGEVDAVVIIFDRDEPRGKATQFRYPYEMMFYAEHENESDLALYCTYPGEYLVGPGISRVEIGGVVSFFPPRGIPDVWHSRFTDQYPFIKSRADRLLLAGIIFSQKKFVVCVQKERPSSFFYGLAHRLGVEILYISFDKFNPVSLRALRNIHMLAGKKVRKYAGKYIQKRRY